MNPRCGALVSLAGCYLLVAPSDCSIMSFSMSVGSATNSLADTAARHTAVYRVCTDMYISLVDPNQVVANKGDFRTARAEIAVSIGLPFNQELGISPIMCRKGPAPVITNVAPLNGGRPDDLMSWYVKWFDCRTPEEMISHQNTTCVVKGQSYFPSELNFAGFVLSDAQAHPSNGDTAVTLFIGGIITILNGRFPITGGEQVHWYLEDEANAGLFDDQGFRKSRAEAPAPQPLDGQNLRIRSHPYGERALTKQIVYVKPFKKGILGNGGTLLDKRRILGYAIGPAAPWQYVDLKICRQSM